MSLSVRGLRRYVASVLAFLPLAGADSMCPSYPAATRVEVEASIERERALARYAAANRRAGPVAKHADNVNYIDEYIFWRAALDSVPEAPHSGDAEFLRRVSLDLTGRIPSPERVREFTGDSGSTKRQALIDSLIGSGEFIDYWTLYYARRFAVTSEYYTYIGIPGRNQFYQYLREFIAANRPLDQLARDLITARGDSHRGGPPNWTMRSIQFNDPIQDTWDELTNRTTVQFLGVQTQCVSCHQGRRHLEKINVWLAGKTREDFWRQAAFYSRLTIQEVPADALNSITKGILSDRLNGGYNGVLSNPKNPGPRPARSGGTYSAVSIFTGETPKTPEWRNELARMITSSRQFAQAQVNYIWAHFFRSGIVDPPDGWDLARLDSTNLPEGATLQPAHPELLDRLTGDFIASGYDIRALIRLIVSSRAYQLSSRYTEPWRPEYERYFVKHKPRRLTAEEIYDALTTATQAAVPMNVEGFDKPLLSAHQLPDPSEPRNDGGIKQILTIFGRGDWVFRPTQARSSALQVLYFMNEPLINFRTWGNRYFSGSSRLARLLASDTSDEESVRQLALAAIGREPTHAELAVALRVKSFPRQDWLSDVFWVFLNKAEFWFNH